MPASPAKNRSNRRGRPNRGPQRPAPRPAEGPAEGPSNRPARGASGNQPITPKPLSRAARHEPSKAFVDLGLHPMLGSAVAAGGYDTPTPIQLQAIPPILDGRDILGCAQTGTGKTAAFALPILHRLHETSDRRRTRAIRALVLAPTRELASQICESFTRYAGDTGLRAGVVFGGVGKARQIRQLRDGLDILVACPGRLLDLLQDRALRLSDVETLVLDEADRLLDMGFIRDVRRIASLTPDSRQTLLFSATMPTEIRKLANELLYEPVSVAVDPISSTREPIVQSVFFAEQPSKAKLLISLLRDKDMSRVLVFTRTKRGADRVAKNLDRAGIDAAAIHGNKSQNARERALREFKSGRIRVVCATDIAARGIDIKDLTHVVNYDMPVDAESYVHRVGRTGRAGASGIAFSFCSREEEPRLAAIEKLIRKRVETAPLPAGFTAVPRPEPVRAPARKPKPNRPPSRPRSRSRRGGGGGGGRG